MHNGLSARAFVFSTYMDSLCITSRMHSFIIAYQYLCVVLQTAVMHAWNHYT